jgi:hypothetical protein
LVEVISKRLTPFGPLLKIVRRGSEPQLVAVEMEADEEAARGLEVLVGEGYRIKVEAGFCAKTLRRVLEVLGRRSWRPHC